MLKVLRPDPPTGMILWDVDGQNACGTSVQQALSLVVNLANNVPGFQWEAKLEAIMGSQVASV